MQSFLGQPLRAEIEIVSVQPGEESSLEARLASGNAFAQAGIEFNPALTGIQFTIDKRDGRPIILVRTRQPVNEPFVDLLVELRWATGLFVREYTVLLDPPGYEGPKPRPMAAAPSTPPSVAPAAAPAPPVPAAAPIAPSAEPKPAPEAADKAMAAAAPAAEPKPKPAPTEATRPPPAETRPSVTPAPTAAPSGQTYEVKRGDTLGEIALQYRPQGVTFHQMLIALQRANEDAFINNNINLVRAGRILNIPDAEAAAAVDVQDANRLVIAQHADFAEYRSRLGVTVATAPAAPQAADRSAAGQITPRTEAPKPAPSQDQLKLSKADPKKPAAARAAREDDLAARERALQEAQSRVTELEKNVSDLKKLLEIRNEQLKQLQDKAAAKPAPTPVPAPAPAPAPVAKAPEAPKPAPAAPAPTAKPAAPSAAPAAPEAAKPAAPEAPKPVAEAPKPAPAPAPVAAKPKPRPMTPPPQPEPSLVDEILGDPIYLGALGLVVLLLGGYGAYAWQRKKKSVSKFQDSVLSAGAIEPSVAVADAGAAAAPAAPPSVQPSSVSQAPAGMGTDDVDPIAEADVYMAYGRDAQAEEILKEALQKDPSRVPVMAKLLEIYANRRDAQAFEQIALKLKGATNGTGPEWDKATALGRNVDPSNGLYGSGGGATAFSATAPAFAAAAAAAPAAAAAAPSVDFDIGGGTGSQPAVESTPSLDLDLGGPSGEPEQTDFAPSGTLVLDSQESKAASGGLDFDLGGGGDKPADAGAGLNFELPGGAPAAEPTPAPEAAPAASGSGGLDFDLNLGGGGDSKEASAPMDLSAISLDLGTPGESAAPSGDAQADPKWQEVATKLDLAKAYEEMGDKDGARELLNEVLREGDAAQQGQANQLLAKLG